MPPLVSVQFLRFMSATRIPPTHTFGVSCTMTLQITGLARIVADHELCDQLTHSLL